MRRTLVTLAAIALASFCFASAVPAPVFAAKKASARYHSQYSSGARPLRLPLLSLQGRALLHLGRRLGLRLLRLFLRLALGAAAPCSNRGVVTR